jgi:catechol 2,3-dioxygenase-like lactoylglutathione lyase family enzyme
MLKFAPLLVIAFFLGAIAHDMNAEEAKAEKAKNEMKLGAFSISLTVKDINKSKAFYEKLGFEQAGGNLQQRWVVLRSGTTVIGLFQGMFPKNMLTFNPGWSQKKEALKEFDDVRAIQKRLEASGVEFATKADPTSTGPASFVIADPDGNPILFDQHVPAPKKAE